MRQAFSKLLGKAARKGAAVRSAFASSVSLAALLLVSPATPAVDAEQGPLNLAQRTYGESAQHCVSIKWDEQRTCPHFGGERNIHYFVITNSCGRMILFSWYDNGLGCHTAINNVYPCAKFVTGGNWMPAQIYCPGGGSAKITWRAEFVE